MNLLLGCLEQLAGKALVAARGGMGEAGDFLPPTEVASAAVGGIGWGCCSGPENWSQGEQESRREQPGSFNCSSNEAEQGNHPSNSGESGSDWKQDTLSGA